MAFPWAFMGQTITMLNTNTHLIKLFKNIQKFNSPPLNLHNFDINQEDVMHRCIAGLLEANLQPPYLVRLLNVCYNT